MFCAISFISPAIFAQAVTINVTTFSDEFDESGTGTGCSLREAVQAANTNAPFGGCTTGGTGQETIQLPIGTYTFTLSGTDITNMAGDLDISSNLILRGEGTITDNTVINANGLDRALQILSGGIVEVNNLTILNSNAGAGLGGSIYNNGTLTLNRVVINGGQSLDGTVQTLNGGLQARGGGGIYNEGTLTITRSTIRHSRASEDGGGLYSVLGSVTITNSTFGENRVNRNGGGIYFSGGTATLLHVTISRNFADNDYTVSRGGEAGGLYVDTGVPVTLTSTLVAGNADFSTSAGVAHDCVGTISSGGGNILRNNAGCSFSSVASDQVGTNAAPVSISMPSTFTNSGGPIPVYYIGVITSPIVDNAVSTSCPATDQRGFNREVGACDVGAVEIVCGDALVNGPREQCDDGNTANGDGCSSTCQNEWTCPNGVLEVTEECDDGNSVDGDGCDSNCRTTRCGNGRRTDGEECDTGGVQTNGCETNCRSSTCGDGILNTLRGEQCDDGNAVNTDACTLGCQNARCGDRIVGPGEECDDANSISGDGCDVNCTETRCGNGVITLAELCDDGALNSNTVAGACATNCLSPTCGDGVVNSNNDEQCDNGVTNSNSQSNACRTTCRNPFCGDGVTDNTSSETCDDGLLNGQAGRCNSSCSGIVPQPAQEPEASPASAGGDTLSGFTPVVAPGVAEVPSGVMPEAPSTSPPRRAARGGGCQLITR